MSIVDLHCHVLPGIDDGPATLDDTRRLLDEMVVEGIETVACTSHMFHPQFENGGVEDFERHFSRLVSDLSPRAVPRLCQGAENFASEAFFVALAGDRVLTLNRGRYLLVEFSPYMSLDQIGAGVTAILDRGRRPVLAHVERYPALIGNETALGSLIDAGCVVQINAQSLLRGVAPRALRRRCLAVLKKGLAHVVASDSHGPNSTTPSLGEAARWLARKFSPLQASSWTFDNPAAILEDREI